MTGKKPRFEVEHKGSPHGGRLETLSGRGFLKIPVHGTCLCETSSCCLSPHSNDSIRKFDDGQTS